jgi:hypothetical protein
MLLEDTGMHRTNPVTCGMRHAEPTHTHKLLSPMSWQTCSQEKQNYRGGQCHRTQAHYLAQVKRGLKLLPIEDTASSMCLYLHSPFPLLSFLCSLISEPRKPCCLGSMLAMADLSHGGQLPSPSLTITYSVLWVLHQQMRGHAPPMH